MLVISWLSVWKHDFVICNTRAIFFLIQPCLFNQWCSKSDIWFLHRKPDCPPLWAVLSNKNSKNLIFKSLWTPLNYAMPRGHWPLSHYSNYYNLHIFAFILSEFIKLPTCMNWNWNLSNLTDLLVAKISKVSSSYAKVNVDIVPLTSFKGSNGL